MTQAAFLFWNIQGKDCRELITNLATEKNIDVVCLAENRVDSITLERSLASATGDQFKTILTRTPKIIVLTRNASLGLREVYADASGRLSIRELNFCNQTFLFALAHFQSKRFTSPAEQNSAVQSFADEIRDEEARRKNYRTILFGDLNMNPFEDGIVMSHGLHAVSTKEIAKKRTRIVDGKELPFFYNPMWGFFGDRTPGPPGTIYYRGGRLSYEWSIFDQVLFRPDVLPWFDDHVEIVTSIGKVDLKTKSGRPNPRIASDHFPVVFQLKESKTV